MADQQAGIFELRFRCPACGEVKHTLDVTRAIPRRFGAPVELRFFNAAKRQMAEQMLASGTRIFDIDVPEGVDIEHVLVQSQKDPEPSRYTFVCEECFAARQSSVKHAGREAISARLAGRRA